MSHSKQLTIFEGCDGSGKTTAAQAYAKLVGAKYVHFGNLPRVKKGLARMYVEAMLPALLGYQDVVFDRSWLSELPYGDAFREGRDRLTEADHSMLERLAMRCGAVVVLCQPPFNVAEQNFIKRKGTEYLKTTAQLRSVYDAYQVQRCWLPTIHHDYTDGDHELTLSMNIESNYRLKCHPLNVASAGNWHADIIIVGESFAERKDQDPWYQWPFGSFSGEGCSRWLTNQLIEAGISERHLLWVNADQDLDFINELRPAHVIALGSAASAELYRQKIQATVLEHPQYHKRFRAGSRYPLIDWLEN